MEVRNGESDVISDVISVCFTAKELKIIPWNDPSPGPVGDAFPSVFLGFSR